MPAASGVELRASCLPAASGSHGLPSPTPSEGADGHPDDWSTEAAGLALQRLAAGHARPDSPPHPSPPRSASADSRSSANPDSMKVHLPPIPWLGQPLPSPPLEPATPFHSWHASGTHPSATHLPLRGRQYGTPYATAITIVDDDRPYPCAKCGSGFRTASQLARHLSTVHSTARKYPCRIAGGCGAIFKRSDNRGVHEKTCKGTGEGRRGRKAVFADELKDSDDGSQE